MLENPNKKNITNLEIYTKLESLEEKIDNEKNKVTPNFIVNFLMAIGLAFFIVGLTFFIQLLDDLISSGYLWVISIAYMGFGLFLLWIGISTYSRIAEK